MTLWFIFLGFVAQFWAFALGAVVALSIAWLYWDAELSQGRARGALVVIGWLALAGAFVLRALDMGEYVRVLPEAVKFLRPLAEWLMVGGGVAIALGVLLHPLQDKPDSSKYVRGFFPVAFLSRLQWSAVSLVGASLAYWRRGSIGLERHLLPVGYALMVWAAAELVGMARQIQGVVDGRWLMASMEFGGLWWAQLGLYVVGFLIAGAWVWGYLLKRLATQLLLSQIVALLVIVLVVVGGYTGLLMQTLKRESLKRLAADSGVVVWALSQKQQLLLTHAQRLADHGALLPLLQEEDVNALSEFLESQLLPGNVTSVMVVDAEGLVLGRGEDPDRYGDSVEDEPLVRRGLHGERTSTVELAEGAGGKQLWMRAVVPVFEGEKIWGAVVVGETVDSAIARELRTASGVEVVVYAGESVSAASLTETDGSLLSVIGQGVSDPQIVERVLKGGMVFQGEAIYANQAYLAGYAPVLDVYGKSVGMVATATSQQSLFEAVVAALFWTYSLSLGILLVLLLPAQWLARELAEQVTK